VGLKALVTTMPMGILNFLPPLFLRMIFK
jgi:hypothetical protein